MFDYVLQLSLEACLEIGIFILLLKLLIEKHHYFELQNLHTLSNEGELMLSIYAAFAQAESEDSSMNMYMAHQRRFKKGIPAIRVYECYGYRLNSDGEIVLDEIQSQVVKTMFDLALQGIWVSKIRAYLDKNGIPSSQGKRWNDNAVNRIHPNEI